MSGRVDAGVPELISELSESTVVLAVPLVPGSTTPGPTGPVNPCVMTGGAVGVSEGAVETLRMEVGAGA